MDKRNILVETDEGDVSKISANEFYIEVCQGHIEPLLKMMNGHLYENEGRKYCISTLAFQVDDAAKTWLSRNDYE
ncbi:hypothetical protein I6N96_09050 [Enterococcus sp. BWM-S5]|uniref:Uncharacterized protein n=1 Tax=Enterococcus larvae TaxID=2794352 RepID=A0ABS4CIZ8_9ENTE|nr:hypothetical protein [Enterococcus larvae]MBP1046430.1 hypothetical protein [Enterococcus larvae]